jgi:hypothetical protein
LRWRSFVRWGCRGRWCAARCCWIGCRRGRRHLFVVALDERRAVFPYHHLVRQVLRAELRARDREQVLRLRAAEWFEAAGETHAAEVGAERADGRDVHGKVDEHHR